MRYSRGIRFEQLPEFNRALQESRQITTRAWGECNDSADHLKKAGANLRRYKGVKIIKAEQLLEDAWNKMNIAKSAVSKASDFLVRDIDWEDWE